MSANDFAIEPLVEEDVRTTAELFTVSLAEGCRGLMPLWPHEDAIAFRCAQLRRALGRVETEAPSALYPGPGEAFGGMRGRIRAVIARHRASKRVAGLCLFELMEDGQDAEHGQISNLEWPTPEDQAFWINAKKVLLEEQKRMMGESQTVAYWQIAAVHPDFRGMGARKALWAYADLVIVHEWGHPPTFLEALPRAVPLWQRVGFEYLQEINLTTTYRTSQAGQGQNLRANEFSAPDFVVHAMKRLDSSADLASYGGVPGALSVIVPISSQDDRSQPAGGHTT
ncbi:hypothetical protein OC845_002414 [Tilletia horrida]|nr:hypothetical protein OC845_002414 [Tilletia horrida]